MADLEKTLGVVFKNKDLLKEALAHRSYLNEHPSFPLDNNERLEFLGDAVLELVVTDFLYCNYKNPEGELTNWRAALVNRQILADIALKLDISKDLLLSRGETRGGEKSRRIILANAIEAVIGAIYLDRGLAVTKKFIEKNILNLLPEIIEKKLYIDAKSNLQEVIQDRLSITPVYKVISEKGPDHAKHFKIGVYASEKIIGKGEGSSKQEAQQKAASDALQKAKWKEIS